jgi:hypothetical protein
MLWPFQMSKKSKPNDKSMMVIDNTVNLASVSFLEFVTNVTKIHNIFKIILSR